MDAGMRELVSGLAGALRSARQVAVITGAGISAESGIRTFRDTMDGLWKDFDPAKLATPEAFARDPELVTKWYDWRRQGCLAAEPNPGHLALARMERAVESRGGRFTLLTQNVDRLHQKAGSRSVVELHGSIIEWRCTRTGRKHVPPGEAFERFPPPSPHSPKGVLRPDVVWFGEMLPAEAMAAAEEAAASCDLFLSVGTSAVVYPAAAYIQMAAARGAGTAEVNRDATPISELVDWSLRGNAGEVLPRVVDEAFR
jgi:NAD-dependent deacetylase